MKSTSRASARAAACVLAGLAVLAPRSADAQQTISLDEAVERALRRSPQMLQQDQAVDNAALAERSAWGAFLPNLSMSTSGSLRSANILDPNTGQIVPGSSDSYSAGLSGRVDIFRGGSRFVELDRADADMQAAVARRESQRFSVALQTKNFFFAALRQADLLEVSQRRVEQAQQNLECGRVRAEVGRATISDSLRARLDVVTARQAVLQGETALRAARFSLGRQIGESAPVVPARPADMEPSELPLSEAEIMQLAEAASPTVVASAYATRAAAASVRSAQTGYLPSLSLSSGYNWNNQERSFNGGRRRWNLRLSRSYTIRDHVRREASSRRAQFSQRVARLQEDDSRLAARQEADAALYNLRTAERAIEIAQEAELVAGEDLRVIRERYAVGVATILDVLISQNAADQASVDIVTSRYDYVLARAELESILGRVL